MKWTMKEPRLGDMVRVKLGTIYHYGVYVSDEEIIQFGLPPVRLSALLAAENIRVLSTDAETFAAGGFPETAELDGKELKKRIPAKKTVEIARSRLGEGGYHILYNNCEHFAHSCVFGEKVCSQAENVRSFWRKKPVLDVYIGDFSRVPLLNKRNADGLDVKGDIFAGERGEVLDGTRDKSTLDRRVAVWKMLAYGLKRSFNIDLSEAGARKDEKGKWSVNGAEISLSHSDTVTVAAVSGQGEKLGTDVQEYATRVDLNNEKLVGKILSDRERKIFDSLSGEEKKKYILERWTVKEAAFKRDGGVFVPSKILPPDDMTFTRWFSWEGQAFVLSVVSEHISSVRFFKLTEKGGDITAERVPSGE